MGDSNPRYGNPYVSLANWWFQPLTQPSNDLGMFLAEPLLSNAMQRYNFFLKPPNFFVNFFSFCSKIVCFRGINYTFLQFMQSLPYSASHSILLSIFSPHFTLHLFNYYAFAMKLRCKFALPPLFFHHTERRKQDGCSEPEILIHGFSGTKNVCPYFY